MFKTYFEIWNQVFYLSKAYENLETCIPALFCACYITSKMQNSCSVKTATCSSLTFTGLWINSYSKISILNFCTLSIFPYLEIKRLVLFSKILRRFDIMLHTWLFYWYSCNIKLVTFSYKWFEFCVKKW